MRDRHYGLRSLPTARQNCSVGMDGNVPKRVTAPRLFVLTNCVTASCLKWLKLCLLKLCCQFSSRHCKNLPQVARTVTTSISTRQSPARYRQPGTVLLISGAVE